MKAQEYFEHCPRCGAPRSSAAAVNPFECGRCRFLFYFNPTVATAAIILDRQDRGLFIRRAKAPGKGRLAMVGGFVDMGETAEAGLRREVREEVNLELADLTFLCSQVNHYDYREVTYPVVDLFFTARAVDASQARPLDAVAALEWSDVRTVNPSAMAFPSMEAALKQYQDALR